MEIAHIVNSRGILNMMRVFQEIDGVINYLSIWSMLGSTPPRCKKLMNIWIPSDYVIIVAVAHMSPPGALEVSSTAVYYIVQPSSNLVARLSSNF